MGKELFKAAKSVIKNSYSPYSNFKVSAAILGASGKIYVGINIENASYPCSLCAESSAIANMITNGDRRIKEMLVMAEYDEEKAICTPCGLCRQRIREFSSDSLVIFLANTKKVVRKITLGELLYMSFGPEHLNENNI